MPVENLTNRVETDYSINRSTSHIPGVTQAPLAGPSGTAAKIIRIHAPVEVEIVTWTATSEGGPPTIPSPYHPSFSGGLNANRILIESSIGRIVQVPIGGGNNGHIFTMSGVYTYAAITAGPIVRDYYTGKYPFEGGSRETNYQPSTSFSTEILDQRVETELELLNPLAALEPGRGP